MSTLLFVVNDATYFFSHRLALAQAAQKAGYEIHVAVPEITETVRETFQTHSMTPYAFAQEKTEFSMIKSIIELNSIVKNTQPDLVHLITLKSSLRWFLLLPFVYKIKAVHTIAGFGQLASKSLMSQAGKWAMKAVLAIQSRLSPSLYVAQNPDDAAELCRQRIVSPDKLFLVQGSGVNTFTFAPGNKKPSKTLMLGTACRRLTTKGLPALAEVSRLLIEQHHDNVKIHVASIPAPTRHREAIDDAYWVQWLGEGLFEDEGAVEDMPGFYQKLDAFIYLSTSGEGLAKTLLEAASCALPIITTRQPGCKEAVIHGQTGFIVDPKRPEEVVQAILALQDPAKRKAMGEAGREHVIRHFADEIVVSQMLKLYDKARGQ